MPTQDINVVLRLLNNRRFQSGLFGSASAVRGFSSAIEKTSSATTGLGMAAGAAEAGLYGVGIAAKSAAYAVGATTVAFTALGISFNATMEGNTLAFEHFAGGVEQSKVLTQDLFDIAKKTPFSFTDITTAARKFLAFGYTVSETKELLDTLGDTLAYVGGGPLEIQRLTKAFGDIRAKGRLMQQELNQLTNVGINPYEMMEKGGLKLTQDQLKNIGAAHISAERAIGALKSGLDQTFGGGSAKYLETFNGQWQRLKDNISQAAGNATKGAGIFGGLKDILKNLNDWVEKNGDTINEVYSGIVKVFGGVFYVVGKVVEYIGKNLVDAFKPAAPFFENVLLPLIEGFAVTLGTTLLGAFKVVLGVVKIFSNVLGFLGKQAAPFKNVFRVIGGILSLFVGIVVKVLSFLGRLPGVLGWIGRSLSFLKTPLNWLISLFGKFKGVAIAVFGGIATVANEFGDVIGGVFKGIKSVVQWVIDKINWILSKAKPLQDVIGFAIPGGGHGLLSEQGLLGIGGIPVLGTGGDVMGGGWAVVGDKGPELINLPAGSSVISNEAARVQRHRNQNLGPNGRSMAASQPVFQDINLFVRSQLVVGKKVLGETVGEYAAERVARS